MDNGGPLSNGPNVQCSALSNAPCPTCPPSTRQRIQSVDCWQNLEDWQLPSVLYFLVYHKRRFRFAKNASRNAPAGDPNVTMANAERQLALYFQEKRPHIAKLLGANKLDDLSFESKARLLRRDMKYEPQQSAQDDTGQVPSTAASTRAIGDISTWTITDCTGSGLAKAAPAVSAVAALEGGGHRAASETGGGGSSNGSSAGGQSSNSSHQVYEIVNENERDMGVFLQSCLLELVIDEMKQGCHLHGNEELHPVRLIRMERLHCRELRLARKEPAQAAARILARIAAHLLLLLLLLPANSAQQQFPVNTALQLLLRPARPAIDRWPSRDPRQQQQITQPPYAPQTATDFVAPADRQQMQLPQQQQFVANSPASGYCPPESMHYLSASPPWQQQPPAASSAAPGIQVQPQQYPIPNGGPCPATTPPVTISIQPGSRRRFAYSPARWPTSAAGRCAASGHSMRPDQWHQAWLDRQQLSWIQDQRGLSLRLFIIIILSNSSSSRLRLHHRQLARITAEQPAQNGRRKIQRIMQIGQSAGLGTAADAARSTAAFSAAFASS
uniref:Clr5 domain-containing protein n=1 Tax=Macrostomum lignano TaxID=282301 RepID=A0A1I8FA83_9PLAT